MPTLSACNIIRIYSKVEDYEIENKTRVDTEHEWEKMAGPRLQLYLVTKSRCRRDLGWPISSAAVLPLKMMPCTLFRSIQTFSVNGKFTERYHIFCAWIDLFTIFVCSRYRPWATIRLFHHFGFVMCIFLNYFFASDAKYVMFRVGWRKSLKGSATAESSMVFSLKLQHSCSHAIWHVYSLWSSNTPAVTLSDTFTRCEAPTLLQSRYLTRLLAVKLQHSCSHAIWHVYSLWISNTPAVTLSDTFTRCEAPTLLQSRYLTRLLAVKLQHSWTLLQSRYLTRLLAVKLQHSCSHAIWHVYSLWSSNTPAVTLSDTFTRCEAPTLLQSRYLTRLLAVKLQHSCSHAIWHVYSLWSSNTPAVTLSDTFTRCEAPTLLQSRYLTRLLAVKLQHSCSHAIWHVYSLWSSNTPAVTLSDTFTRCEAPTLLQSRLSDTSNTWSLAVKLQHSCSHAIWHVYSSWSSNSPNLWHFNCLQLLTAL